MSFPYDGTGVEVKEFTGFDPVPENMYDLEITDFKEQLTRNGDQMVNITTEIVESLEYNGRKIWHNIVFLPKEHKAAGIAIHFLKCIGEPCEGKFIVDPDNWITKRFRAKVGIEQYTDKNGANKKKNAVIFVEPPTVQAPTVKDVPF